GLSCFLLPRVRADGLPNVFQFQRLDDRVYNRSNASSVVEFAHTPTVLVGEDGRGVRTIIEVVYRPRRGCAIRPPAGMSQSVGEEGRGGRTLIEMVARTRLGCVIGSAAGMRQAVAEATWDARHRSAFGALLIDQPAMVSVLADLALESEAATMTAMRLARAHD